MNDQIRNRINQSHVLVTGGAGFIGSYLVECLVQLGAQVTVLDNLATGRLDNLQCVRQQIELVVADLILLLQSNRLQFDRYQYVFHLAANPYVPPSVENPAYDYQANLHTTFLLLEALRQTSSSPRLVNISSAAVYGNPVRLPIHETDPAIPISPYGVSKLAAERYVEVYSQLYGIPGTSLRFFSVYGPRQRKQVIYDFLDKLRVNSNYLEVLGDGSQVRDFTYVLDVVQAILLAATVAPGQGEVYNVASGTTHTIAELVATLCSICGVTPQVRFTGQIRPGDADKWVVDTTRLKQLGFKANISLEAGIAAVKAWYETQHL